MQSGELQSGIASADIAAEPHLSVGLGECAKGKGARGPRSNHGTRLEAAGGRWRINFLPAVMARCAHSVAVSTLAPAAVLGPALLNGRTRRGPIRAEHAAVALLGLEQLAARGALVKVLASACRAGSAFGPPRIRT